MKTTKIKHEDWEALVAGNVLRTKSESMVECVKDFVRKNRRPMTSREIHKAADCAMGENVFRLMAAGRIRRIAKNQYIPGPNA